MLPPTKGLQNASPAVPPTKCTIQNNNNNKLNRERDAVIRKRNSRIQDSYFFSMSCINFLHQILCFYRMSQKENIWENETEVDSNAAQLS